MASFRPVFGTFLAFFVVPAHGLSHQTAGAACDQLHSEEQRHAGLEALRAARYAAAARAFQESFDACPSQHSVLLELSRVNLHQRDFPEAIRNAQRYLELEPASMDGRLALANAYFMAQSPQDALREVAAVLKADRRTRLD